MSLGGLLNQTVSVQGVTSTQNALGGNVKTFANKISSVKAGFRPIRGGLDDEGQEFNKTTQRNFYRMYLEYSTSAATVVATDRVTWGSQTLEVKGPGHNPGGRNVLLHIDCEEIK